MILKEHVAEQDAEDHVSFAVFSIVIDMVRWSREERNDVQRIVNTRTARGTHYTRPSATRGHEWKFNSRFEHDGTGWTLYTLVGT